MKMRNVWLLFLVWTWAGCALTETRSTRDGGWIDLTYAFSSETIYWPTSEKFQLETVFAGQSEAGFYYSAYKLATAEHGGTHLDAPVHFGEGQASNDALSLDQLIGNAVVIDTSAKALTDRDYRVSLDDLKAWERSHGQIPRNAIVLLRTGYGRYWPDPGKYLGTALRGVEGVAALHFPGLHPEAAHWLIENRGIKAIGIDTASIDRGQSQRYRSHRVLAAAGVPVFENVANLDQLPATGAWVIALPMKIAGGSGGPLRIIARLGESPR